MNPKFTPPKDDAEFKKRATEMTIEGAKAVLTARRKQKADAIKPFDEEISFLERVLKHKGVTL